MTHIGHHKGLFLIVVLAAIAMIGITAVDEQWTFSLNAHKWPDLQQWMNRSVFEGELPGANDPVIVYLLGLVSLYYAGWRGSAINRLAALRPQCGFALASALVGAVYLVHSLKWIVGRARPAEVLYRNGIYSDWFAFGPHFISEGIYSGAFPSGHTAQAFILMTMAYILAADPLSLRCQWARVAGWTWGLLCVALSLAMASARCMSLSHWLSDGLGAIMFGWVVMHLLYFHVLRVPDQRRYFLTRGKLPELPPAWEIVLCVHVLIGTIGIVMVLLGIKAIIIDQWPWLVLLVPAGAVLIWLARQQSMSLLRNVWQAFEIRKT